MKKVAVVQSNYIPWKGYFDMIASVDEFVLYDDMQFTRRDWRNRNQIKTPQGVQWLTVPVKMKGKYFQKICETEVDGSAWQENHWKSLVLNYKKARCFDDVASWLEPVYLREEFTHLSLLNRRLLELICRYLGIKTRISSSRDYIQEEGKSERLASICRAAGATHYISGPAAMDYLDSSVFERQDIQVQWFDYGGYPEYQQLWGSFVHGVSVLDLLFNHGRQSASYMKFIRPADG